MNIEEYATDEPPDDRRVLRVDDGLSIEGRAEFRERQRRHVRRLADIGDERSEAVRALARERGGDPDDLDDFLAAAEAFEDTAEAERIAARKDDALADLADLYRSVLDDRFEDPTARDKRVRIAVVLRAFGRTNFGHGAAVARATDAAESYVDEFRAVYPTGPGWPGPDDVPGGFDPGTVEFDGHFEAHDAGVPTVVTERERNRQGLSRSTREEVLARDGRECLRCGADSDLEVHHVEPVSLGGSDDPENIATLCADCHGDAHRHTGGRIEPTYPVHRFEEWLEGEVEVCGAPTADGSPCSNPPGSCPHHD